MTKKLWTLGGKVLRGANGKPLLCEVCPCPSGSSSSATSHLSYCANACLPLTAFRTATVEIYDMPSGYEFCNKTIDLILGAPLWPDLLSECGDTGPAWLDHDCYHDPEARCCSWVARDIFLRLYVQYWYYDIVELIPSATDGYAEVVAAIKICSNANPPANCTNYFGLRWKGPVGRQRPWDCWNDLLGVDMPLSCATYIGNPISTFNGSKCKIVALSDE